MKRKDFDESKALLRVFQCQLLWIGLLKHCEQSHSGGSAKSAVRGSESVSTAFTSHTSTLLSVVLQAACLRPSSCMSSLETFALGETLVFSLLPVRQVVSNSCALPEASSEIR